MTEALASLAGKYEIVRRLEGGGMGRIYLVRHRELDELRVVKVIRGELAHDENLRARFVREARLASQLRHPSIAQILDFSTDEEGNAFLVMEFIDGVTFEALVGRTPPVPLHLTLELCCQALSALGLLHRKGYVHRDIAPDNLMLTRGPDGERLVKLIDLGIAKSLQHDGVLTSVGSFVGKLRYAPPEQLMGGAGEHALTAASDLYSFGIVLYELTTGESPIVSETTAGLLHWHLFKPPRPFAETDPEERVPEALRALILRCLEKRPADRPASAQEVAAILRAQLPLLPPEEDSDVAFDRALREGGRRPQSAPRAAGSTQERLDREFGIGDASEGRDVAGPTLAVPAGGRRDVLVPAPVAASSERWDGSAAEPQLAPANAAATAPFDVTPAVSGAHQRPPVDEEVEPGRDRRPLLLAVVAATVLAIAIGWWALRPSGPPATTDRPGAGLAERGLAASAGAGAGAAAATARLELVALPWATVTRVENAAGEAVPVTESETPAVLTLPAGRYVVLLAHPALRETRRVEITLAGGATHREVVDLGVADAARYFERAGWSTPAQ